jgi:ABC-type transport system substrate-binding protein
MVAPGKNFLPLSRQGGWSTRTLCLVLIAVVVALTSCAGPLTGSQPGGGSDSRGTGLRRVVAAIRSAPASLAQQRTQRPDNTVRGLDAVEDLLHAGLTSVKEDGSRVPVLAEAVPTLENGLWKVFPDGRMEITWTLKPTAQWHDGTPLTVDDLLFAASVERDHDLPIPPYAEYDLITGMRALDARTVVVEWRRPYIEADGMFSSRAAGLPLPRHLLEQAYSEDKVSFLGLPYWTSGYVGAGPFRMREWVEDSHAVFVANGDYILGRPRLDEVEVRFIPDPNALMTSLLAGLDMSLGKTISLDQAIQIKDQWQDGSIVVRRHSWTPLNPQFINPHPAVVTDPNFRRALISALDRQQLADTIFPGYGAVAHSYVSTDVPHYNIVESAVVKHPFQPRLTGRILETMGYTRGADGMLADATGHKLTLSVYTPVQNDIQPKTLTAIADAWQQVGIATEQVLVPQQRMMDREYVAQFPAFELVERPNSLTVSYIRRFHSSQTPLPENSFRLSGNSTRYRSGVLDAFIDSYTTTIPIQERMEALANLVHHQTSSLTQLPIFYGVEPTMVANRLVNVTPRGESFTQSWNAHLWDVKS